MKKAVIIFSIDDGRADLYRLAKEILIPQNMPATFNITTDSGFSVKTSSITREELADISKCDLFEIANHSDMHTNKFDDIYKGFLTLCDWLGFDKTSPIGFASPNSEMSLEYIEDNIEKLNKVGVKYVRTSREDYFNKDTNSIALTSYPVKFDTTLKALKEKADIAVENGYCLIYLFHSVCKSEDKNYGETWSYDFDKFLDLVMYIKELQNQGKADIM
ncbi:MAG: hypothetical protein IJ300_01625, partial [Clostridia bacterium]|nr:hypothetical protein [Clostridia bacterium]